MITDYEQHCEKLDGRARIARKVTFGMVLSVALAVGVCNVMPSPNYDADEPKSGDWVWDETDNVIYGTSDAGEDVIYLTATGGGIDICESNLIKICFDSRIQDRQGQ